MNSSAMVAYGAVELLFLVVKLWALLVWLRAPSWAWSEAGHSRSMWLLLLVLALVLPLFGFGIALWFLFVTSSDVKRITQLGRRPGFPGQ